MFNKLLTDYKSTDRAITALTVFLAVLAFALFLLLLVSIYRREFQSTATLLGLFSTTIAGLIVSLIASRHITYEEIKRNSEARSEVVMITHHLIAVSNDLEGRIYYIKTFIESGDKPASVLQGIPQSIDRRYEMMLDRHSFKYLSGETVDGITGLSGSIYGLNKMIELMLEHHKVGSIDVKHLLGGEEGCIRQIKAIESLCDEIKEIRRQIFTLRDSLDAEAH